MVRTLDPGGLNAQLVTAGIRVTELAVQRRSLEQVVLELTGSGSDRFDGGAAGPRDEPGRHGSDAATGSDPGVPR